MGELLPVLVMAIITLGIYKIFELFVRRNERMAIIEKLSTNFDPQLLRDSLKLPIYSTPQKSSWAIKIGLLLVGIGLGITIASIVDLLAPEAKWQAMNCLYPACACLFGGLGLVIAYFIEQKDNKKENK